MKNNQALALLLVGMMALAALFWLAMCALHMQYQELMLVVPYEYGALAYDVKEIEQISDEDVAVTYEIKSAAMARTVGSRQYPVTRVETNSCYDQLLGLQILEGSFFMEEAVRAGNRYAVLNNTAAYQLFGSYNIVGTTLELDGDMFLVIGVVKDQIKKEAAVYVPSGIISAPVHALLVKTEAAPETVRSSLMPLGMDESISRVIDLQAVSDFFRQQLLVGICLCAFLLLTAFTYRRVWVIGRHVRVLGNRGQTMYCSELIRASRKDLQKVARQIIMLLAGVAVMLLLLREVLEMVLGWNELIKQYKLLSDVFFEGKVQWLVRYFYCGPLLLFCFLVLLSIAAGLHWAEGHKCQNQS